jgi:signal peptidase I
VNENKVQDRKPVLALALSIFMTGLGQVYNGEIAKGLSLFLIAAAAPFLLFWLGLAAPGSLFFIFVFLGALVWLAVYVLAIVDAWKSAKKGGKGYRIKYYNKPYVYIAMIFFSYYFVLGNLSSTTREKYFQAFRVQSGSMAPSILHGDNMFVDKRVHKMGSKDKIQRGDIVAFVYPNDRTMIFLKRVVGLPGDEVEIRGTDLFVNGRQQTGERINDLGSRKLNQLLDDYIAFEEYGASGSYNVIWLKDQDQESTSLCVPNGQIFVLSDDRSRGRDSRHFWTIPLVDIVGKAKQVYFSIDPEGGIRWNRIGKILR